MPRLTLLTSPLPSSSNNTLRTFLPPRHPSTLLFYLMTYIHSPDKIAALQGASVRRLQVRRPTGGLQPTTARGCRPPGGQRTG